MALIRFILFMLVLVFGLGAVMSAVGLAVRPVTASVLVLVYLGLAIVFGLALRLSREA